jgi:hypothetical protein
MKKQIVIACKGASTADIEDLHELQDDLKELPEAGYEMLKDQILSTGFAFPILVWQDSKKKLWVVGGHQRKRTLQRLKSEGFFVPKLPITFVEAANAKEAKRRVLQDVAQYGKINAQGLYDFMDGAKFKYEDVYSSFKLPDFDMGSFETEFFSDLSPAPKALSDTNDKVTSGEVPAGSVTKIILFYSVSEYPEIVKMAAEVGKKLNCSNLSQLFSALLKKESNK